MSVIVAQGRGDYLRPMSAAIRLLALIALVLMPLGMAPGHAMAHHAPHAAQPGHCDDRSNPDRPPAPRAVDCVAACTALPANEASCPTPRLPPEAPGPIALAERFVGIVPEIATPPPKIS
jgi:hypothetical protein